MKWTPDRRRRALDAVFRYARPYRWVMVSGLAWTLAVVAFRLLMPWPLRGVVEVAFGQQALETASVQGYLPSGGDAVIWLGIAYLVCAALVGVAEMRQRIAMMRFSAQTVHDLREAAVRRAKSDGNENTGDLIARTVGDTARIKAGLAGILVHMSQNGLLFIGVTVVMALASPILGLVFLVSGVTVLVIGFLASEPVARSASKHRQLEGDYAATLQQELDGGDFDSDLDDLNQGSAKKDVKTTQLITRATLLIHVVLAGGTAVALWFGVRLAQSGQLAAGDVFLFIAYAMTVHRRMVQVGRQAARVGKVLASADRVSELLEQQKKKNGVVTKARPLRSAISLQGIKLPAASTKNGRTRLKRTHLSIPVGQRVAVVGAVGSGKSSLLRVLAGVEVPPQGQILWDDDAVDSDSSALQASVAYLPQEPVFGRRHLWQTLGLPNPEGVEEEERSLLERIGAWSIVKRRHGLETKLSSRDFSRNEARLLRLANILVNNQREVWVLDNPLEGLSGKMAKSRLEEIVKQARSRTLIVSLSQRVGLDHFDRIVGLRHGRVTFDGTPKDWRSRKMVEAEPCKH